MTWTYTGNPAASPKDAVRFRVGDTDFDDQLLQDEEILYLLGTEATVIQAAARAADGIAARFSRLSDKAVGDLRISFSQKSAQYRQLAMDLRSEAGISMAIPFAGGISRSQKETQEADADRVQPSFKVGLDDHPGTVPPTDGRRR